MKKKEFALIGIDGGATKVSSWIIDISDDNISYSQSSFQSTVHYSSLDGYISNYIPVPVPDQIMERDSNQITISKEEEAQGKTYIKSTVKSIASLASKVGNLPLVIGIGMPGLKTTDLRGINVIANGPRMVSYCDLIESELAEMNIQLAAPIARLGSDADYCGIGELYAKEGTLKNVNNAYYLGGGTGAADALVLKGQLVPFDQIKPWMAKTWEMKNDQDLSLERYASASGLQYIYSRHSKTSTEQLNTDKIYSSEIAALASQGDTAAKDTFKEISRYLALLIYERITTLYCGSINLFKFVNPNRDNLNPVHEFKNEVFDQFVIGQRLGDLMSSTEGQKVLTIPFLENLSTIINNSDCLSEETKSQYCDGDTFKREKIVFSKLREAPALGAGIDAYHTFRSMEAT